MTWAACVVLSSACMRHIVVKGAVRVFPINGGRRGGAAHLLNGADAWSSRRPLPTITEWGEVASPVASALHACHVALMRLGWRTVEAGNRPAAGWAAGRSQFPAPSAS